MLSYCLSYAYYRALIIRHIAFVCNRMLCGHCVRSRVPVASLVRRLRHGMSRLRQDGVDFCFRFRSAAGCWSTGQRMQHSSSDSSYVVSSPHPELALLKRDPLSVPHFLLDALNSYSKRTALVRKRCNSVNS